MASWTFVRTYLLHGGFLDGREGFMLAVSNAEGAYYKYVKLTLRQRAAGKASSRMNLAVIVTTYNRPECRCRRCWRGLHDPVGSRVRADWSRDDGSAGGDRQRGRALRPARAVPGIARVGREDHGFRAAAIRNQAAGAHRAIYVVFTDGDCVPSRTFVHQHRRLAEPGAGFLSGRSRVAVAEILPTRAGLSICRFTSGRGPNGCAHAGAERRID
jgi:hypothetical protein